MNWGRFLLSTKNAEVVGLDSPVVRQKIGRAKLRGRIHAMARWVHIYLSMASFAIVLFFASTGFTLNHPDLFAGHTKSTLRRGRAAGEAHAWLSAGNASAIAGQVRTQEKLRGSMHDAQCDDQQCQFSCRAPGYSADGFVDRNDGAYTVTITSSDWLGVLNDLHRGHDATRSWRLLMDATAIFLCGVSLSGILLVVVFYRRRAAVMVLLLCGVAIAVGILSEWLL